MNRVKVRPVAIFLVLSFGLAWLVALPLWLDGGLANPLASLLLVVMMSTPAIAALIVTRFVDRPASIPRELGLWPLRPARRLLTYLVVALVVTIAIVLVALPIGAVLGVYPADFTGFSAFREATEAAVGALPVPIGTLVVLQFVNVLVGALINTLPALGEELGWRGYLLPKLMPLGAVPAILISGVVWGLWHAPIILLGYNYPTAPGWLAIAMMCGTCILVGAILGWVRIRSNSVWPAALGHGAFNAAAGMAFVFSMAGEQPDFVHATVLGWSGWIVPVVLVVVLVARGGFRKPAVVEPNRG